MRCLIQFSVLSFSLSRRRCQNSRTIPPSSSYSSLSHELSLTSQLLSILHTRSPQTLFHSLDLAIHSPQLTPHVISTVLSQPIPFPSAFYFYTWACFKHLDSCRSHDLIISILQSNIKNIDFLSLLDDVKASLNRPISSRAFAVLIKAYSESGLIEDALEVFRIMFEYNSNPSTAAYNAVLDVLVKKGAVFLAMGVFNQMEKSDCPPNKATFCILIQGFCKAGMFDDALKLLAEMENKGLKANEVIYTIILSGYCRMNMIDEAELVFDSMKKSGCTIDSIACHAMLSGYCKLGRVDVAFNKLKEYEEEFGFVLNLNGYSSLVDMLFKANKFDNACRVYEDMLKNNIQPDHIMYTTMIRGFLDVRRVKEAFGFFDKMVEKGIVPNTFCYNTLMQGLCDVGYIEKAHALMLSISKCGLIPDSTTYNIMITGLCRYGLVHDAQQIFNEMSKFGIVPTIHSYNSLLDGLYKAGKFDDARCLYDKMKIKPSLVLRLSQGINRGGNGVNYMYVLRKKMEELGEMGQVVEAYKLFKGIMDGVVPDVVTFTIRISRLFKGGKPNEAMQLFKALIFFGIKPNETTYLTVMEGLLKIDRIDEGLDVCQCMLKDMILPNLSLCYTIMKLHCNGNRVMQAIKFWLNHISTTRGSGELDEIEVIKDHFEQGCIEDGVEKLIKRDIVHGLKNSSPYTIWLIGFCRAGKLDGAIKIFNTLVKFDLFVTTPSCAYLIHSLCSEKKLGSAFDVMLYALGRGLSVDPPIGNRLLRDLCMEYRKKEAHELVWRMSLTGYDVDVYLRLTTKRLLYGYCKHKEAI